MAEVLANFQFCESRLVSKTYHIQVTFEMEKPGKWKSLIIGYLKG